MKIREGFKNLCFPFTMFSWF